MADSKNDLDPIEFAQKSPEERVRHVEQWPSFPQMSPEKQEQFRNAIRNASPIDADLANTKARHEVWVEEVGPGEAAPKPPRGPRRPRVNIKQMEKSSGKTVSGVTVTRDSVAYTLGEPSADSEPNPWHELYDADKKRPS